jgi:vitamin B12/bleomycin/antimicrobial peptide transport system ATP-binding/permease protein
MSVRSKSRRQKQLTRRFWRTGREFWLERGSGWIWVMTIALAALIVTQVLIQYGLNLWNRVLFDALEQKQGSVVLQQAALFVPLAIVSIAVAVLIVYVRMRTQRRWRRWYTDRSIARWLDKGRYYQLNLIEGDHQNPEHRMSEDMRIATEAPLDFAVGILAASLTAITFIGVLWSVGGGLTFDWGDARIVIPGYLVIAVVAYCAVISTGMVIIARSFVPSAERKNQSEAEFRSALTRVREYGESIAILGGEREERAGLNQLLHKLIAAWARLARQYMRTAFVSHGNFIIASVLPVILAAPKYLAGEMSLGQVMQAAAAFVQVQYAFNWLVDNYPRLAEWQASARRVASLLVALDHLDRLEASEVGAIRRVEGDGAALRLRGVSVMLSDGTVVVDDADAKVDFGERVLVSGDSGTGKSTLVRAIAGLWPWGEGEVVIEPNAKLFLMPQKPYIPLGTLRRAATYPMSPDEVADEKLRETMDLVGLGHVSDRLDEEDTWDRILSGGEQQRLAFVRLFLHSPDIVVMDEATSALDTESQGKLLDLLHERLPNTAIISVGHRPELEAFHERKIKLVRREGGARLVDGDILAPSLGFFEGLTERLRRRKSLPPPARTNASRRDGSSRSAA